MDIAAVIDFCRKQRHLPKELTHRRIRKFGAFLKEMVRFLVFGECSEDIWLRNFQNDMARDEWNPEEMSTYVALFHHFWRSRERGRRRFTKRNRGSWDLGFCTKKRRREKKH